VIVKGTGTLISGKFLRTGDEKALLELEDEDPYVSDEEKDDMEEEDDAT
jgi:hypothetical protein